MTDRAAGAARAETSGGSAPPEPERPSPARLVGVLGGTFDPIHLGHLALGDAARHELGLDEVLFVPAGEPPHKLGRRITAASHRLAMVELAIAGRPRFVASRIEIDRAGPSYTVETLEALLTRAAAGGRPIEVTLILSAESFAELPTWRRGADLLRLARIAVAPRPGHPTPTPARLSLELPGVDERVDVLAGPHLDISASAIRARVAAGRSIDGLVPQPVATYIETHHLYRQPA